jgi:ParB family chromosome partitioning protein
MPSKQERELMAGAAERRPREQMQADVATTIIGRMGQDTAPPQMLKLHYIAVSAYQSRGRADQAYIEALAESIRIEGLHDPIIVRPLAALPQEGCDSITPPQPRYELIAGHHRLQAYAHLGRHEIPAFVRPMSDAEAARALTTENTHRRNLGDWELYKHAQMLRRIGAATSATELGRLLNVDRTVIPALDGFAVLPLAAQQLLDDHPTIVGYNLAKKFKAYCPQHELLVLDALDLLAKGKLTQASVPAWIEERANPRADKPKKDIELGGGVRLVYTAEGARVSGNIDYDALHRLVEENLPKLLKTR